MSAPEWLPAAGSPPKPHGQFSGPLEVAVVHQRLSGVEDRLYTLELLVAKTVAKLDEQSNRLTTEIRTAEFSRLQQQVATDSQEQFSRYVREQLEKLVSAFEAHEERIGRVVREMSEQSIGRFETRLSRSEAKAAQLDQLQREAATQNARQLAQAVKLLQSHMTGQVDALSTNVSTKLQDAEKERSEFLLRSQEMQTSFLTFRTTMSEARAAAGQVQNELTLIHSAHDQLVEDVKVLNRRLMSAVRHLATNPTEFLETPTTDSLKTPTRRIESAAEIRMPTLTVNPGTEIDAFIAELNFLTRNGA